MIARRKGERRASLPEKISASPPVEAAFAGQAVIEDRVRTVRIEAAREVVVSLPATRPAGLKRGELRFRLARWPDRDDAAGLGGSPTPDSWYPPVW